MLLRIFLNNEEKNDMIYFKNQVKAGSLTCLLQV